MAKYSTQKTEKWAVDYVNDQLSMIEGVMPNLVVGDKGAEWDGSIDLYKDESGSNSKMIGHIFAQVKGVTMENLEDEITFNIKIDSLKNYLHNNGCIFFVVGVKNGCEERKIYIRMLAPELIKEILKEAKGKKTTTINLKAINSDKNYIKSELLEFFYTCVRQSSFSYDKSVDLEDVFKNKIPITIPFTKAGFEASGKATQLQYLTSKPFYIYFDNGKYVSSLHPIAGCAVKVALKRTIKQPVVVDGETIFDYFEIVEQNGKTYFGFGDTFMAELGENGNVGKMNLTLSSILDKRIREAKLILGIEKTKTIYFGEKKLDAYFTGDIGLIKGIKEAYPFWVRLDKALKKLGVSKSLDISAITEEQKSFCDNLVVSVLDGKPFVADPTDLPLATMDIGNLKFIVAVLHLNEKEYRIANFYDSGLKPRAKSIEGYEVDATLFSCFTPDDWVAFDNIPFEEILPSYQSQTEENPRRFELYNHDLLNMIEAYDRMQDGDKKKKLIETALQFSQWILDSDKRDSMHNIHLLNIYQIKKRLNTLSEDELTQIEKIARSKKSDVNISAGAYIILDNLPQFNKLFVGMNKANRNLFMSYPIYNLYKQAKSEQDKLLKAKKKAKDEQRKAKRK